MRLLAGAIAAVVLLVGCSVEPDPYCNGGSVIISPFDCPSGRCAIFNVPVMSQGQYDVVKRAASRPATEPSK